MAQEFVHLHNHTEYSLLDGACKLRDDKGNPGDLFNLIANEYKMSALAITDHGNMYGAMEFYWAAKQSGLKPIIGCEIYVAPKSRFDKNIDRISDDSGNYNHLILLAKDFQGYQNLMRIVSIGFTEGFYYKPRVDKEVLRKYSKGLIVLSGCIVGEVATALLKNNNEKAQKIATEYQDIFGKDNFYIEIMDNGLEEQQRIIPSLLDLSKKTGIPLVATNDCHFLRKEDFEIHDILLCIGTNKMLDDPKRLRFNSDLFYYRSPEDMIKTFSYVPEAIKNTLVIAEKTNLEISTDKLLLPQFPVPKEYKSDSEYLEYLCNQGLKTKYVNIQQEHRERLKQELAVINRMGFASYFLIVADFVKYSKDHGISVGPGRGSGAGSMVAYTLDITDICPLKYDLLFERFLNPDRRSMPDLDIDFADFGRDEVIKYVRQKYGEEKCAQIITFGSMQARLVIKDVARVLGFTPAESNNIAKLVPHNTSIKQALESSIDLSKLVKSDKKIARLITISQKLEGLKRHTGVHAAGMVIANEEITNYSPLAKSKEIVTTQYDGIVLPQLGLLKIDFLGLRTLTIIDDCVKFIQQNNPIFNLDDIPLDDNKTYQLLEEAKTMGVFQLEGRGVRDLIRKLKPSSIDDIIALIALYRPGPMGGAADRLDDFVNRKHGKTKIVYDHPLQEPILKSTYGVILYQEQVMKMSVTLAGFTPGEADTLRKAMSKKVPEVIEKQREKFISGAKEKGIDKKISEKIFHNIVAFGGYGFNKSHSAAYGVVSYRTAYLKANYSLEYLTALLNSEIGRSATKDNEESKLVMYLDDASTFGISVLPPDIQYSDGKFKIEGKNIRFGLLAIKNVGEGLTESIEQARKENGVHQKFKDWDDFLKKIDLKSTNKKALESLAKAGTFDSFGKEKLQIRADLIASIDSSVDKASKIKQDENSAQGFLFDSSDTISVSSLQKSKPLDLFEALDFEKEVLGFYLSGHPLTPLKRELVAYSNFRLDKLPEPKENVDFKTAQIVRVAGMIVSVKKLISKTKKESYARLKIEDLHGSVDVIIFPKNFEKFSSYLTPNNVVVVKGSLMGSQGQPEIIVEDIITLEEAKKKFPPNSGEVHIKLSTTRYDDTLNEELKKTLERYKGKAKVFIDLEDLVHGKFSIETGFLVECSDKFINDVETSIGTTDSVELHYSNWR